MPGVSKDAFDCILYYYVKQIYRASALISGDTRNAAADGAYVYMVLRSQVKRCYSTLLL